MTAMCVWTACGSVDLRTAGCELSVAEVAARSDYLWIFFVCVTLHSYLG